MPKELQIPNRETKLLLDELEQILDLPGDVVEFGCYEGDTSILLAGVLRDNPDKWLYLYDSFEGFFLVCESMETNLQPRGIIRSIIALMVADLPERVLPHIIIVIPSWLGSAKSKINGMPVNRFLPRGIPVLWEK